MEVLKAIYTASNKNDKRQKLFILHCLMKRDGVDKMLPLAKQDSEWGSKYEPKNN